ncbi:MAG: putative signal transducing protein [Planctomycetota bacterium]
MAKRSRKRQKTQVHVNDMVAVSFTEDMEKAREYEALLKNNDIPTLINEQQGEISGVNNIAIMVPEEFIDEAHVVIESQDAYDDFYDFAVDKEDDDDDYFDDSF